MTIQEQAQNYLAHFTTIKKASGETVHCFTNESLADNESAEHKALSNILHNASENMSVDNAYNFLVDYLEGLTNLSQNVTSREELDDIALEYTDSAVSVYTLDLVQWLAESLNNVQQVNNVINSGEHENITNLDEVISQAQANARFQVAQAFNELLTF